MSETEIALNEKILFKGRLVNFLTMHSIEFKIYLPKVQNKALFKNTAVGYK